MIRIEDILQSTRIFMDLGAAGKSEGLAAMTQRLATLEEVRDAAEVHRLLMAREALMTTGVKHGFAFPHAFSPQFAESFLTIGVFSKGLEYDALDSEPVQFVFLLLGPPHHQTVHLQILARVSRLTGQPEMLDALRATRTAEDLMELMVETERRLVAFPYKAAEAE